MSFSGADRKRGEGGIRDVEGGGGDKREEQRGVSNFYR